MGTLMRGYLEHCRYPDHAPHVKVIIMFVADRTLVWFLS